MLKAAKHLSESRSNAVKLKVFTFELPVFVWRGLNVNFPCNNNSILQNHCTYAHVHMAEVLKVTDAFLLKQHLV